MPRISREHHDEVQLAVWGDRWSHADLDPLFGLLAAAFSYFHAKLPHTEQSPLLCQLFCHILAVSGYIIHPLCGTAKSPNTSCVTRQNNSMGCIVKINQSFRWLVFLHGGSLFLRGWRVPALQQNKLALKGPVKHTTSQIHPVWSPTSLSDRDFCLPQKPVPFLGSTQLSLWFPAS